MFLRKLLFVSLLTLFSLTVIGYGIYKALPILAGPKIEVSTPQDGDVSEQNVILVRGTVHRAKALYINQTSTPFSEDGSFATKVAVYPGSNILIFDIEDKFGRTVRQTITVGAK